MKASRTVLVLLGVLTLSLSGCRREEKIIPRDTMRDIYVDLFISDQWLREQGAGSVEADTMRFYEPIFRKYGYTTRDFRNSANHYLKDPRRFARILQRASSKMEDRAKYLERLSMDIATVRAEIERLKQSAHLPPIFYNSAFFARSAGFRIDIAPNEWGAYMPMDLRPGDATATE